MWKNHKADILVISVLIFLILGLFMPPLLSGQVVITDPAGEDVSFNIMPNVYWVGESYRHGFFPLWNPHTSCGMPHLAYTHCSGLYPVSVFLFSTLRYALAGSFTFLFHTLLVAVLFYLLLRGFAVSPFLAGAASLIYALSGLYFNLQWEFWMVHSTPGVIAMWLASRSWLSRPRWGSFAAFALATLWAGLGGDTELVIYTLLALYLMVALSPASGFQETARRLILLTLPLIAAGLFLALLYLPTFELQHHSQRGPSFPLPLKFAPMGRIVFWLLPTIVLPFQYFGRLFPAISFHSALSYGYQGFLMSWLTILGIAVSWRWRALRPLAATWIFFFVYVLLREQEETTYFFDLIPVLGSLHFSMKSMVVLHAVAVVMAFLLLEKISAEPGQSWLRLLALLLIITGVLMIVTQPWCVGGKERYVIGAVALIVGFLLILPWGKKRLLSPRTAVFLAAGLWAIEVYFLAWTALPRSDPTRFQLSPELDRFAHTLSPETRYAIFEPLLTDLSDIARTKKIKPPVPIFGFFELAAGAGNVVGPSRLLPARHLWFVSQFYRGLIREAEDGNKLFDPRSLADPASLDRGRLHLLNLSGVKFLLTRGFQLPSSSPYSLQSRFAVDWQVISTSPATTTPGFQRTPLLVRTRLASLPGDQWHIKLEEKKPGPGLWLTMIAKEGTGPRLLYTCFLEEREVEKQVNMEPLLRSQQLFISLISPPEMPQHFRLESLYLLNPSRPFQQIKQVGEVSVYENTHALPRAFVAHQPIVIRDWTQLAQWMNDPQKFNPAKQVGLEQASEEVEILRRLFPAGLSDQNPEPLPPEPVQIQHYASQRVVMTAQLFRPGFLVFTDTYFPGWRAYLKTGGGEQELRIFPADLAFRAVFLPEGKHQLTWLYQPTSFQTGLWVSLTSLLMLFLFSLGRKKLTSPPSPTIDSEEA